MFIENLHAYCKSHMVESEPPNPPISTVAETQSDHETGLKDKFVVHTRRIVRRPIFVQSMHTVNLFLLGTQYRNWAPLFGHIGHVGARGARAIFKRLPLARNRG